LALRTRNDRAQHITALFSHCGSVKILQGSDFASDVHRNEQSYVSAREEQNLSSPQRWVACRIEHQDALMGEPE